MLITLKKYIKCFFIFYIFVFTSTIAFAQEIKPSRCGTKLIMTQAKYNAQAKNISDCTKTLTTISNEYWPTGLTLNMPVWFHVIHKSNGDGNVTDAAITAQMQVLNEDYAALANTMGSNGYNSKIQFTLEGITRTQNDNWFNDDDNEATYKSILAVDTDENVNIYTTTADGYLGYAYFPQDSAWAGDLDGIVLNHAAVGGRNNSYYPYNQGRTLVHEMGHYLGLFHTFEGGSACENGYDTGDFILDTPAESQAHFGCTPTTTCGSNDPIDNYMSYSDDSCMDRFSPEQANRMVCSVMNYRPNTFTLINDNNTSINPSLILYLLN